MPTVFERCFEAVLGHEGGYVNNRNDPGGETKFGISRRAHPGEDIKNMTVERAREIYKRDYWDACRCDELPPPLALLVFDAAVNCGVSRSTKWLQQAVGSPPDGFLGPITLTAVRQSAKRKGLGVVCRDVLVARTMFHVSLPTWRHFGLGWARRLLSLPFAAAQMAAEFGSGFDAG